MKTKEQQTISWMTTRNEVSRRVVNDIRKKDTADEAYIAHGWTERERGGKGISKENNNSNNNNNEIGESAARTLTSNEIYHAALPTLTHTHPVRKKKKIRSIAQMSTLQYTELKRRKTLLRRKKERKKKN